MRGGKRDVHQSTTKSRGGTTRGHGRGGRQAAEQSVASPDAEEHKEHKTIVSPSSVPQSSKKQVLDADSDEPKAKKGKQWGALVEPHSSRYAFAIVLFFIIQ